MHYERVAGIVIVQVTFVHVEITTAWGYATVGTLPEGFRPSRQIIVPFSADWASGSMGVQPSGAVNINANADPITTGASISAVAVYPVA